MAKKTLIITQEQLDEINSSAGLFDYLDGMAKNPDMSDNKYADEVSSDGGNKVNSNYPEQPITGDDYEKDMANTSYLFGYGMGFGRNGMHVPHNLFEVSKKKDWERKNIYEANQRLENLTFDGKPYDAVKQKRHRIKKAVEKTKSDNPIEVGQGVKSLNTMINNDGEDFGKAQGLLSNAERADKIVQANRAPGTKIKSAPKESGNGKAHSKKPEIGIISPVSE